MSRTGSRSMLAAAALAWGLLPWSFSSPRAQSQTTFRGGVDLVQFDVVVLDDRRRPVLGLTAADFIVTEDGQPRPIDSFAAISLPEPAAISSAARWIGDGSADVVTNQRPDEGRLVVIMMDRSIMSGQQTLVARDIARAAVEALGPADLAAVVRNDGYTRDGEVHGFTSDKTRLRDAVESPFTGFFQPPEMTGGGLREAPPDLMRNPSCVCGLCVLESIAHVARTMAELPRRQKTLLFIGSNLLIQESDRAGQGQCSGPLMLARKEAMLELDRSNVTVHAVDTSGLQTLARGFTSLGGGAATLDSRQNLQRQANLAVLPGYTGGRVVANTNDPQEFVPAIFEESRAYYLIGLQRREADSDDQRREIRIAVRREGVTVRSRRGYYPSAAPPAAATVVDVVSDAMTAALPRTDLPLTLSLTPTFQPDGTPRLTVLLGIQAPASAEGVARDEQYEVLTGVFDMRGVPVGSERLTFEVPAALTSPSRVYGSRRDLPIEPGSYEVRVGVVHAGSGRRASVYGYVDVPDPAAGGFAMSGVLVDVLPRLSNAVRRDAAAPIAPSTRRTFTRGDEVSAFAGIRLSRAERLPIVMHAAVIDAGDRTVAQATRVLAAADFNAAGLADYRYDIPTSTLGLGRYLLRIEASGGDFTVRRDVPFSVE